MKQFPILLVLAWLWEAITVWYYKCPVLNDGDGGWAVALAWFHQHQVSVGHDVVYTFGPLGWIYSLEVGVLNFWGALEGWILRLAILWGALQISGLSNNRKAIVLLWLGAINWLYYSCDVEAMTILGCCSLAFLQPHKNKGLEVAAATLATLVALGKFTWLVAAGGVLAIPILEKIKERKLPMTIIGGIICGEILSWILNAKINFGWGYILWGLEISRGYRDNMMREAWHPWSAAATFVALTIAIISWIWWHGWKACGVLGIGYLAYQASTVRADYLHEKTGLLVAGSLLLLGRGKKSTLLALVCLGVVVFLYLPKTYWDMEYNFKCRGAFNSFPQKDLTFFGHTVDILSDCQGILATAEMDYTPRPAFHSCDVYTRKLAEKNLKFYRETPPEFVLMKIDTPIDDHLVATEDPLCVAEVLQKWDYERVWNHFLVFKRGNKKVSESTETHCGTGGTLPPIEPYETIMLKITKATEWMRAHHQKLLGLSCKYADGKIANYRLCPGNADAGFIISPRIATPWDVIHFKEGKQVNCTDWTLTLPKGKIDPDWKDLEYELITTKPQK